MKVKRRKRRLFRIKRPLRLFITTPKNQIIIPLWKIFSLLTLLLSLLCFYFILRSDIFLIRNIKFQNRVSPPLKSNLRELLGKKIQGKSIFFLDLAQLEKELPKKFPQIKKISFQKKLPDQLLIRVEERKPVAVLRTGAPASPSGRHYFLVDKEGVVFAKSATFSGVPLLFLPEEETPSLGKEIGKGRVNSACKIISLLGEKGIEAEKVFLKEGEIEIILQEKIKIIFPGQNDFSFKVASLQSILSSLKMEGKIPKEIDLRFERPVVRF